MTEHGQESTSPDQEFAAIYNDTDRFPNLTDVALELGISYQTVRNKACILKGRARRGEAVPKLISRVIVAKERETLSPQQHAHRRAEYLKEDIDRLLTQSRYPVLNPEIVVVEPNVQTRYDRLTGRNSEIENTPRTWLSGILRVEPVTEPQGRRFLFTGAQNDSPVDPAFWANLVAYANYIDADIVVGPGTYETQWWSENQPAVRRYDDALTPYLCFGRMELGENFMFAGEMNMLPTANRPVSDLATYSEGKWAVFPHAKRQLKSIPSLDPRKQAHQVMTTGMVTRPKVIPRKAGIKSISYHALGAVLVEFDLEGDLFCRQITAAEDGSFYDLEYHVRDGKVGEHDGIDALVMGDLHTRKLGQANADATFRNSDSVAKALRTKRLIAHDIFDNEARNHHHIHDNAHSFEMAYRGRESVFEEIQDVALLLQELSHVAPVTVIESNHDIALERYVREGRYRNDGINIRLGLQLEDAYMEARERIADAIDTDQPVPSFSLLEHAVDRVVEQENIDLWEVDWVHDGYSYEINGVECGNHGFRGANGARGTVQGFAALGRKMTIADKHSPEICDNVFVAGCMNLRHGYNKGPSGWAIAHVVQYPDGNRTLLTMQNSKWRAK